MGTNVNSVMIFWPICLCDERQQQFNLYMEAIFFKKGFLFYSRRKIKPFSIVYYIFNFER